jgi:hypothetical protein
MANASFFQTKPPRAKSNLIAFSACTPLTLHNKNTNSLLRPQRGGERTGVNGDLPDYRDKMMFRGVRYENEIRYRSDSTENL